MFNRKNKKYVQLKCVLKNQTTRHRTNPIYLFGRSDNRKFGKRDTDARRRANNSSRKFVAAPFFYDGPFCYDEFVNSATFNLEFSIYGDTTIGKMFEFPLTSILYMNMNDCHS